MSIGNWIKKHPKEAIKILDLEPKVIVGSLEKIKDQLTKDGIEAFILYPNILAILTTFFLSSANGNNISRNCWSI